MTPEIGSLAPGFALKDQHGQVVRLADFAGDRNVALVFYPFAFSRVCTGELCAVRDSLPTFESDDVAVLAVSCDPMFTLRAFADADGLTFPLLSDFWPHGEVARAYEVFDETKGCPSRSSYVVDKQGMLRWAVHNAMPEGRDLDEHLRQLSAAV